MDNKNKKRRSIHIPVTSGGKKGGKTPEDKKREKEKKKERESSSQTVETIPKDQLAELRKKAKEYDELLEASRRLKAEYANFQKRLEREREDYQYCTMRDIILKFLPVADNLERAIESAKEHAPTNELLSGVEMVHKQFMQVLESEGVTPIESVGKKFNPREHEAFMVTETDEVPPDTVISEVHRGYKMGDRVLRCARVIVSRKPQEQSEENDNEGGATG